MNVGGTRSVLDAARQCSLRVYSPSSIAVFGPGSPKEAPQDAELNPTTVYGETKVTGEQMAREYLSKFEVDTRGIRYPGLVSYKAPAGGGTTDYAVEIFHAALESGHYDCFVRSDTRLPMLYMDDAIRATISLMQAPPGSLGHQGLGTTFPASHSLQVNLLMPSPRGWRDSPATSFPMRGRIMPTPGPTRLMDRLLKGSGAGSRSSTSTRWWTKC